MILLITIFNEAPKIKETKINRNQPSNNMTNFRLLIPEREVTAQHGACSEQTVSTYGSVVDWGNKLRVTQVGEDVHRGGNAGEAAK